MEKQLIIPYEFEEILKKDSKLYSLVVKANSDFSNIINDDPYFFPGYTNHKLLHSQHVLDLAKLLIAPESLNMLNSQDIAALILSALGHDIGMHITFSGFKALIKDIYLDDNLNKAFADKKWSVLWSEYKREIRLWDQKKKFSVFGREFDIVEIPADPLEITEFHRLIIGEFIRWNHHRLAQDIIINGFPMREKEIKEFLPDEDDIIKKITALLVRSHCENPWAMVDKISGIYGSHIVTNQVYGYHFYYIMALLRISDYLDMSGERANLDIYKKHEYFSSISKLEWEFNQCINYLDFKDTSPECLFVWVREPKTSVVYLKVQNHLSEMQTELDTCWAVLGYTKTSQKLSIRRITSNLDAENGLKQNLKYIPERIFFDANKDLLKLLVKPLYGNDVVLAVRELLQNAIDACREKEAIIDDPYSPAVDIDISENQFIISDNGMGMNAHVIKNYYLKAGATYRNDLNWKKRFIQDTDSIIIRGGRFGIGVLAGFLLGDEISVETKPFGETMGYSFVANLDAEQIDVLKFEKKEEDSGTCIKIKNSKKYLDQLKKSDLMGIYVFETPIIRLTWNHDILKLNTKDCRKDAFSFVKDSMEIYWHPVEYTSPGNVSYNGFWLKKESFSYTTDDLNKIEFHIIDKNNILELELNRNFFSNKSYFEKDLFHEIIRKIMLGYVSLKKNINQLCGAYFENSCLKRVQSQNDEIMRIFALTNSGYTILGLYALTGISHRRLIVIEENPGVDIIKEILDSDDDIILIVNKPCDTFVNARIHNKRIRWDRLVTNIPLYPPGVYGDIKYMAQKYKRFYNYRYNRQIESCGVLVRDDINEPTGKDCLSEELAGKLAALRCQFAEYTILNDSPVQHNSIFYDKLFQEYVLKIFGNNMLIPYDNTETDDRLVRIRRQLSKKQNYSDKSKNHKKRQSKIKEIL